MSIGDIKTLPPIGLRPRFIAEEARLLEVRDALKRYLDAGYVLPIEWTEEYNELAERALRS